ncbi:protein-methionine-sulfoxide reductase heme-binding subunit MsrQ [Shewanella alkalitolerans]|uniref:protein-methionine-sulfoxide reductase heme-binding subunit MsrQ n=1 Tax=Shewanella alkalitolerans TaxID=2864209 RepID=UPI001C660225|nr:protein-methionine-sulfoxide reductase heme-binding subunit MsrQ [Shewanella alkalitolerans]QYJ96071.1 protein-methionine-sulfoxide reductase heme-binding subunit MsrQ [Shewanella alkalitolerans]
MFRLQARHLLPLKIAFHLIALVPLVVLVWRVLNDQLGGDPVQYIIHYTGMGAINSLIAVLLISPVAKHFKVGLLMQTRRLVGLYVFAYASLHILAFLSLDLLFAWQLLLSEIVKRPYILVGATAYLILVLLAITSFAKVKRAMGRRWQQLHNWVYLVALLAPIHFYWSVKSEVIEPSLYLIGLICLLLIRVNLKQLQRRLSLRAN